MDVDVADPEDGVPTLTLDLLLVSLTPLLLVGDVDGTEDVFEDGRFALDARQSRTLGRRKRIVSRTGLKDSRDFELGTQRGRRLKTGDGNDVEGV